MNRPTTESDVAVYGMIRNSSLVVTIATIHTHTHRKITLYYSHFIISLSFVIFNLIFIEHSGSYISFILPDLYLGPDPDPDPDP